MLIFDGLEEVKEETEKNRSLEDLEVLDFH